MDGRKARIFIAIFLLVDFLSVTVFYIWFFVISRLPDVEVQAIAWVVLLLLWNLIPAVLGFILRTIASKKNSILLHGGTIGYILLGIGSHIIFQLNFLFRPDSLDEYAGHGPIMFFVSPVLGIVTGAIGFLLGSMVGKRLSYKSEHSELKIYK